MAKSAFPPFGIITLSVRFFGRNLGAILARTGILLLAGCMIVYGAIMAYLASLEHYLQVPTDAHASIVLAVAGLSALVLLFVYALILAAICDLALGHPPPRRPVPMGHQEWRLYAALLRFGLVMIVLVILACVADALLTRVLPGIGVFFATAVGAGLLLLALRIGFLLPAVAMATPQGVVLRTSWRMSHGLVMRLLVVAAVLVIPGVVLELLGETFGRVVHVFPSTNGAGTIQAHIMTFTQFLPYFSVLLSISVVSILSLQAIASVTVYRALTGDAPADGHAR